MGVPAEQIEVKDAYYIILLDYVRHADGEFLGEFLAVSLNVLQNAASNPKRIFKFLFVILVSATETPEVPIL
jgi:hypothetical protein